MCRRIDSFDPFNFFNFDIFDLRNRLSKIQRLTTCKFGAGLASLVCRESGYG